jgi:3-phenylpropionate/cinnamic acid dioxygenase small subunit
MLQPAEIEDRIRIHDLFVRYTTAVDDWNESEVLACFTDDAVLETPVLGGRFEGREGQRRFIQAGRTRGPGVQTRHIFTNLGIRVDGDRATARSCLVVYSTRNGKTDVSVTGGYDCQLRKVGGEWLFVYRRVFIDGKP